mgnify:FL=1
MATQATAYAAEAKAKRERTAYLILEQAGRKALDESLDEKDRMNWSKLFLAKTLPDLKAVEHSGETTTHVTGVDIKIIG